MWLCSVIYVQSIMFWWVGDLLYSLHINNQGKKKKKRRVIIFFPVFSSRLYNSSLDEEKTANRENLQVTRKSWESYSSSQLFFSLPNSFKSIRTWRTNDPGQRKSLFLFPIGSLSDFYTMIHSITGWRIWAYLPFQHSVGKYLKCIYIWTFWKA